MLPRVTYSEKDTGHKVIHIFFFLYFDVVLRARRYLSGWKPFFSSFWSLHIHLIWYVCTQKHACRSTNKINGCDEKYNVFLLKICFHSNDGVITQHYSMSLLSEFYYPNKKNLSQSPWIAWVHLCSGLLS